MPAKLGKVLLVQSSPRNVDHLKVNVEARGIRDALRLATWRVGLVAVGYVGLEDLVDLLEDERPDVLHFSGHGTNRGIVLEDDNSEAVELTTHKLAQILKALTHLPRCVVLNACYADKQAKALGKHVPTVIGTPELSDEKAVHFASRFYRALATQKTIEAAFELAKAQTFSRLGERRPVLIKGTEAKPRMDGSLEIYARFPTTRPAPDDEAYEILLGVRGLPDDVTEVVFDLDDESFKCENRYFPVKPVGNRAEETITSWGNFDVRMSLWGIRENLAIRSSLVDALVANYGTAPNPAVQAAIKALSDA